jgi:hypothetical protein
MQPQAPPKQRPRSKSDGDSEIKSEIKLKFLKDELPGVYERPKSMRPPDWMSRRVRVSLGLISHLPIMTKNEKGVASPPPLTPILPSSSNVPTTEFCPDRQKGVEFLPEFLPETAQPSIFCRGRRKEVTSIASSEGDDIERYVAIHDIASPKGKPDGKLDIADKDVQVAPVRRFRGGIRSRGALKAMRITLMKDFADPLSTCVLLADSKGNETTLPLLGATASLLSTSESHPKDVQPSFANNGVFIQGSDSKSGWIVASPTADDQRSLLDHLCKVGCIMRDLKDHVRLLPNDDDCPLGLRLGRLTTLRRARKAKIVALKVATDHSEMLQLLNEARFLTNLDHDGIVRAAGIYDAKIEGRRCLAMMFDYKRRSTLSSWIPTNGFLERVVFCLMAQICDALVYLNGIAVVHGNVEPSNVLCECADDGSVKVVLADFRHASQDTAMTKLSRCGAAGYIAPEMFCDSWPSEKDKRSFTKIDVFSFGMTTYATALGSNPFLDKTLPLTYERNARGLLFSRPRAAFGEVQTLQVDQWQTLQVVPLLFTLANVRGCSDELQSLLAGLCESDPGKRMSISEASARQCLSSKSSTVTWVEFEQAGRD